MKIQRLIIEGFKSVEKRTEIDFTDLVGLNKIVGKVGSGKTTLGEAILFALFGDIKGKKNDDIVNYRTDNLFVQIEVESKGKNLVVKRSMKRSKAGKTSSTDFEALCDGVSIIFSNKKEAQSVLENDYYDVNRMAVEMLCVISFNNFKSLLSMKAADKTSFMDDMFGFAIISDYVTVAKSLIKEEKGTLSDIAAKIDKAVSNIHTLEEIIPADSEKITQYKKQYEEQKKKRDLLAIQKQSLEDARTLNAQPYNDRIKELDERFNSENSELVVLATEGKGINKSIADVDKDINIFKSGCCPTCGQSAPLDRIENLTLKKKGFEDQLVEMRSKYRTHQSIIDGIKQSKSDVTSELNKLYDGYKDQISNCETEISSIDLELAQITANIKYYLKLDEQNKAKDSKIAELNKSINESKVEKQSVECEMEKYSRILDILQNKVKVHIVNSFIPAINKNIKIYTDKLRLPFSIRFDDEFNVHIFNNTLRKAVAISSLSTGQTKSVDTCIILGILDSLMNKINFNVSFFDELMSNMDADLRDDICSVLHDNIKPGKVVFIINHAELNDQFFHHKIDVVNDTGTIYSIQ